MAIIGMDLLSPFAVTFMQGVRLTPAERAEVLHIAQGFVCKDSAAALGLSPATIRERRKRIYRKLRVAGSAALISTLLARSLAALARSSAELQAPGHGPAQA
jgi:DNA-binding CsgD family transcriptional regulator